MPLRKSFTNEQPDDTERHLARAKAHDEGADDAEGHAMRPGRAHEEEPEDDTEGHGIRVKV